MMVYGIIKLQWIGVNDKVRYHPVVFYFWMIQKSFVYIKEF